MRRSLIAGVCSVVAAIGCSSEPTLEIAAANAALDSARVAEAQVYGMTQWTRADSLRKAMTEEVAAQTKKFPLGRSYAKATELAAATKATADSARHEAVAGKEQARSEAMTLLTELRSAITELSTALAGAPTTGARGKEAQALKAEVDALEQAAMTVDSAVATSRFADARTAAQAAQTQVEALKTRIGALRAPTRRG